LGFRANAIMRLNAMLEGKTDKKVKIDQTSKSITIPFELRMVDLNSE
jgi:hypothetical protein